MTGVFILTDVGIAVIMVIGSELMISENIGLMLKTRKVILFNLKGILTLPYN